MKIYLFRMADVLIYKYLSLPDYNGGSIFGRAEKIKKNCRRIYMTFMKFFNSGHCMTLVYAIIGEEYFNTDNYGHI